MKYVAALQRVGLYAGGGILTVVVLLTIAALTPRQWGIASRQAGCEFKVYVSGDMMHTNLFVPVHSDVFDWSQHLDLTRVGKSAAANYRYLQFGWGDRIL